MFPEELDPQTEDQSLHGGRIRSFKHERGNWATYVFFPCESINTPPPSFTASYVMKLVFFFFKMGEKHLKHTHSSLKYVSVAVARC